MVSTADGFAKRYLCRCARFRRCVLLWWLGGRILLGQCEQFLFSPPGLTKWKLLTNFVVLALLVYNLMPLDVLVSLSELRDKWEAGNIRVIPFHDFQLGGKAVLLLALASLRVAPFAFFAALQGNLRNAVLQGLAIVVLLEAVKVPIFSRSASVTNLLVGSVGVVVVALSASMILRILVMLDRGSGMVSRCHGLVWGYARGFPRSF